MVETIDATGHQIPAARVVSTALASTAEEIAMTFQVGYVMVTPCCDRHAVKKVERLRTTGFLRQPF
jgi:hypothetical protein